MKLLTISLTFAFFMSCLCWACPAGRNGQMSTKELEALRKKYPKEVPAREPSQVAPFILPWAGAQPWGGNDPTGWRPEAIAANAASEELNRLNTRPGILAAVVALPAKIRYTNIRPYGDGQTNAALTFNSWNEFLPPVVASLGLYPGYREVTFRIHKKIKVEAQLEVSYLSQSGYHSQFIPFDKGSRMAVWRPTPDVVFGSPYQNVVFFVRPDNYDDWFPLDFKFPMMPITKLITEPPSKTMKDGRGIIDPEMVSAQRPGNETSVPFQVLINKNFSQASGYVHPTPINEVHGFIPGAPLTAVGGGWTWLVDRPIAPFKMLYTCFAPRNLTAEAQARVPSGGGWHEIGDPAETIINSLEKYPIFVGFGAGKPALKTPSNTFSYGLEDVLTFRLVKPGEAEVTAAGMTTLMEEKNGTRGSGPSMGRFYHWFAFPFNRPVCTEEWVHLCPVTPQNSLGLRCGQ